MECRFLFANGKRCRCRATTNHVFCHHHAPQPRPRTLRPRDSGFRNWLDLRRHLVTLLPEEIPAAILTVLSALLKDGPGGISDRNAGVLLRTLLRRAGSVPFTLPDDPEPKPDYAFALAQSIDRVTAIVQRYVLKTR